MVHDTVNAGQSGHTDFRSSLSDSESHVKGQDLTFFSREEIVRISQFVISSDIKHSRRVHAFTEHGAIMAANVLNSPRAVQMSVFVVRAFLKMRETLAQNKELAAKLPELERKLTARLDDHEQAIIAILDEIKKLMKPAPEPEPKRSEIGFHVRGDTNSSASAGQRKRFCRQ